MKTLILSLVAVISSPLLAQTFAERMESTYKKVDQYYDLECRYSYSEQYGLITPTTATKKLPQSLEREFSLNSGKRSLPLKLVVREKDRRSFEYLIYINNELQIQKAEREREFDLAPLKNAALARDFDTSKIKCNLNFATDYPIEITDGNYHISVHPHKRYDWLGLLKSVTENYLARTDMKSMIMLEAGNYRGNLVNLGSFLKGESYSLPVNDYPSDLVNVPLEVPLYVAPAGYSRFDFKAKDEVRVTFTGGNHNYCIWNSSRRLLESYMRSTSTAKIIIDFDAAATVAQQRGMEEMNLSFPRNLINQSNLLKNLLKDKNIAERYHYSYHNFFKIWFMKEFTGMFKEVHLVYKALHYSEDDVIQGNGERILEIQINYINQ